MTHDHLTEDQCIALTLDDQALPSDAALCSVCAARHQQISDTLLEVTGMTEELTDAAFPPEKLARQRTRILQRIEHFGRQARILAFPVRHVRRPSILQPPSVRRWVAGAAAAGLIIGMLAGHMAHEIHPFALSVSQDAPKPELVPLRASSDVLGDNELLRSIQAAVDTTGPSALRRIADVTPDAWDVQ
jgi:hypothetical protein